MKHLIILGIIAGIIMLMVIYPHTMLNPGELTQGHQDLSNNCFSCHTPFNGIENNKCIACHKLSEIGLNPSDGKDTMAGKAKILFHEKLSNQSCITCHTDHEGLEPEKLLAGFKHNLLSETIVSNCVSCHLKPADDLHQQLNTTCKACHNTEDWKRTVKFDHNMLTVSDKNNCVACHQKPADKLHKPLSSSCIDCHSSDKWTPATFDHDLLSTVDKNNCASCHENPSDAFHRSLKDNCSQCHSTDKWVPANFDHNAYFVLDSDHNASCNTCHKSKSYDSYTCYGCHEHTESNIRSEHIKEGISNFTNCVSCHRSADEDDIQSGGNYRKGNKEGSRNGNKSKKDDHDDK